MIVVIKSQVDGKECDAEWEITLDDKTARGAAYTFLLKKIYDGLKKDGITKAMTAIRKHYAFMTSYNDLHIEGAKL